MVGTKDKYDQFNRGFDGEVDRHDPSIKTPKVLFLGYNRNQTIIIDALSKKGCEIVEINEKIVSTDGYDLVISFGYRHILSKSIIDKSKAPIINLHISYLPWNKGAHPNFWSFFDCTPSGVSIHIIDEGIDTGPIIYQKYVNFSDEETTFSKTYKRLINEIEKLFISNIDNIISNNFRATAQRRQGTFHRVSDLPKELLGWDIDIKSEILRLDKIYSDKFSK